MTTFQYITNSRVDRPPIVLNPYPIENRQESTEKSSCSEKILKLFRKNKTNRKIEIDSNNSTPSKGLSPD